MPNKYASIPIEKSPVYNALNIGFDAQSGKLPSTDAIKELFGNTRDQLEIEREKLRKDPAAWTYNQLRKSFFVGSAVANAQINDLKPFEVTGNTDYEKDMRKSELVEGFSRLLVNAETMFELD